MTQKKQAVVGKKARKIHHQGKGRPIGLVIMRAEFSKPYLGCKKAIACCDWMVKSRI